MKALKAITVGTSALALIPLASAADGGLISQGVEMLFGATTGGGIFTKLGLFIILFAFLALGAKKIFPEEHSRMGTLVAGLLALMGMKFMPEIWVVGLGTVIWVAALALLPYAIVSIFLKEDTKKKWIFVVLAYLVLLFTVFQMKSFPSFARSMGLSGEFWDDMSYNFGKIGEYRYVWIIAAAFVALIVWLFTRKGKGDDDSGSTDKGPSGDKGPGLFKKALNGLGKGIAAPFKLLGKGIKGLGKGISALNDKVVIPGLKGIGKGIGKGAKALGRGVKKIAPGFANGVAKGAKGLGKGAAAVGKGIGKGAKWVGGKIKNRMAKRAGKKAGEEFRKRELEYDAEQRRIIEEKKRAEEKRGIGQKLMEALHLRERPMLPEHAGPSGTEQTIAERERATRLERERIALEEARMRERGASEAEIEKFKRLALEKQERELDLLVKRQREEEAAVVRKHEEEYLREERERELAELKAREEELGWMERRRLRKLEEERLALQRREEEERLARQREEEQLALKRRQEEEMWREREAQERAEQKELALREEAERKAMIKAERLAEERERKAAAKAEKARIEAEREAMARQRREEEFIRKKEGRILQAERKAAKAAAEKRKRGTKR